MSSSASAILTWVCGDATLSGVAAGGWNYPKEQPCNGHWGQKNHEEGDYLQPFFLNDAGSEYHDNS
jgi:hypothetical protein